MNTGDISGPGLLFVQSRITDPIMSEEVFMHWYDTDHIAEVVATSGIDSAIRWKHDHMDTSPSPYLSVYPLEDIAFLRSSEFHGVRVRSPLLPGSGLCYDLAFFSVGYYNVVQVADPTGLGKGHTKSLVVEQVETTDGAGLDSWYKTEYLPALAKLPGYLRTTRFELKYARSNDQSRAFKGLPSEGTAPPTRPTWLAMHEFATDSVEGGVPAAIEAVRDATPSGKAARTAASNWDLDLYHIAKEHGKADLFHGRTF